MSDEGVSVTEGKATIYFPTQKGVFYNPPQVPNRDLSVLALQQFSEEYAAERAEEARVKASKAEARRAKLWVWTLSTCGATIAAILVLACCCSTI